MIFEHFLNTYSLCLIIMLKVPPRVPLLSLPITPQQNICYSTQHFVFDWLTYWHKKKISFQLWEAVLPVSVFLIWWWFIKDWGEHIQMVLPGVSSTALLLTLVHSFHLRNSWQNKTQQQNLRMKVLWWIQVTQRQDSQMSWTEAQDLNVV